MSDQSEPSHSALPLTEKPPDFEDDKLRAVLPEVWKWFETVFPRQKHPGRAALVLALIRCLSRRQLLLRPKARSRFLPPLTEQQEIERVNFHLLLITAPWQRLESQISELLEQLTPPIANQQREIGKVAFTARLKDAGLSDERIVEMLKLVSRKRRGRPPDRLASLRAWDLRLLGRKWKDLPAAACPCNKGGHDEYCEQSMRQSVMRLQKIARRYNVAAYAEELGREAGRSSKRKANL